MLEAEWPELLVLKITDKHCSEGKRLDCEACPTDLALIDEAANHRYSIYQLEVEPPRARFKTDGRWVIYKLPPDLVKVIIDYDGPLIIKDVGEYHEAAGIDFIPGEYTLTRDADSEYDANFGCFERDFSDG